MAETPMPYEMAIAVGDLSGAARESTDAFRRASVSVHHFKMQLEALPPLEDDASERNGGKTDV